MNRMFYIHYDESKNDVTFVNDYPGSYIHKNVGIHTYLLCIHNFVIHFVNSSEKQLFQEPIMAVEKS